MMSPEQMRKKEDAMRESGHHAKNSTVDGSRGRDDHMSHMAHMNYDEKMKKGE